ncbi:MAG TPA: EamA family transporter [Anaerolineales bacterium]|nr:EamA family transporter [Anaerolineales bacterium]
MKSHRIAVFQALFVVFLWATSWVFVKIGLQDIPPIPFAGLRYFTAFLILAAFLFFNEAKHEVKQLSKRMWQRLVLLGILMYAATQGAVFVTLDYLPAVTTNLLMSFSTIGVATLSIFWLSEKPTWLQWGGILLAISGAMIYFLPVSIRQTQMVGVIVGLVGMATNVVSSVLGREINRAEAHHPLLVTVISMGAGSILLLVAGFAIEQPPVMTLQGWGIILWLALANTAFAFTLWNHTLRTLTATQSSVIGGTMMIWVPILAYFFIGENITSKEILGLVVTGIGTLIVQLRKFPSPKNLTDS